jgi:hypothetical protein
MLYVTKNKSDAVESFKVVHRVTSESHAAVSFSPGVTLCPVSRFFPTLMNHMTGRGVAARRGSRPKAKPPLLELIALLGIPQQCGFSREILRPRFPRSEYVLYAFGCPSGHLGIDYSRWGTGMVTMVTEQEFHRQIEILQVRIAKLEKLATQHSNELRAIVAEHRKKKSPTLT